MEAVDIILSIISIIGVISSILFAYLAFHRNSKGDANCILKCDIPLFVAFSLS